MRFYKNKKFMEKSVYTSCVLGAVAMIIRTILLLLYFDNETGLSKNTGLYTFFNIAVYGIIALILVINIQLSMDIAPITSRFRLSMPPIAGYSLFLAAVAFLIQGVAGFLKNLFAFLEWNGLAEELKMLIPPVTIFLPLLIDVLALLSAVAFYLAAMEHFREDGDEAKQLKILAIPVIWCAMVILELLINTLTAITVQNLMEKTLLYVLVLLFIQYIAMWGCGMEPKRKPVFSVFVRITFPIISVACTLPYGIAYLFGMRDFGVSTPIIAIIGLSAYGFIILLQYLVASMHFFNKTKFRL